MNAQSFLVPMMIVSMNILVNQGLNFGVLATRNAKRIFVKAMRSVEREWSVFMVLVSLNVWKIRTVKGDISAWKIRTFVNQDLNLWSQKQSESLNRRNAYVNEKLKLQEIGNVVQCSDMTFFRRGSQWVDASLALLHKENEGAPAREVRIGSKEFSELVDRLVSKQRQSCLALGQNLELAVDGIRYRIK